MCDRSHLKRPETMTDKTEVPVMMNADTFIAICELLAHAGYVAWEEDGKFLHERTDERRTVYEWLKRCPFPGAAELRRETEEARLLMNPQGGIQ
jgi:hypothetical protein